MKKIIVKYNSGRQILSLSKGYTIIETMIAVSLFLLVVVTGMGALLNANLIHNKSNDTREILDNLSFIMEDMSRNLRTGYNYHCVDDNNWAGGVITNPSNCESGGAIAFEQQDGNPTNPGDQWIYSIEGRSDGSGAYDIFKSIDGSVETTRVQLNPDEVTLEPASEFVVTGALPPGGQGSGDYLQPFVTIKLIGKITYKNVVTPFTLQTSVSQRKLDIRL